MKGDRNVAKPKIQEFYDGLQTVSKLVGDLALNIAEAQTRLDEDYLKTLTGFVKVLKEVVADQDLSNEQFIAFFKSLAPSKYQFTETTVEVKADLQMAGGSEIQAATELGYKTPVLAATVNASYVKRSAYDYRAAASIRTVLHAVPPDLDVLQTLLSRTDSQGTLDLPDGSRFHSLAEAFTNLLGTPDNPDLDTVNSAADTTTTESGV